MFYRAMFLTLTALLLSACVETQARDEPLFIYNDTLYASEKLTPLVRQKLYDIEEAYYRAAVSVLKTDIVDLYLQEQAQLAGKAVNALRAEYFPSRQYTDAEKKAYYEANRQTFFYEYELMQSSLDSYMAESDKTTQTQKLLAKIEKEKGVRLFLTKPEPAAVAFRDDEVYPQKGTTRPKVEVIEYADFSCPYCRSVSAPLDALIAKYKGSVRLTFRYFIIHQGDHFERLARAGYCAHRQDKFWIYHDYVFTNQNTAIVSDLATLADQLKLDKPRFEACVNGEEAKQVIARSHQSGLNVGVTKTPSFFVNGKRVSTGLNLKALEDAIKAAL